MEILLRNRLYTVDGPNGVVTLWMTHSDGPDTEVLQLSLAAAEDLSESLSVSARFGRSRIENAPILNPITDTVTGHYYDNIHGYERDEPCLHEDCGQPPIAHKARRSVTSH